MTSIAREPIKKLLGTAMRAEIDSDRIYTEMSNRVKNPLLIQKFRILAPGLPEQSGAQPLPHAPE